MPRTRPLIAALAACAILAPAASAATHSRAPLAAKPPTAPCDFQHRMDIAVINGIWFECSCEALMVGTVCDWYEITSPAKDPTRTRRVKRHAKRPTHGISTAVINAKPVTA